MCTWQVMRAKHGRLRVLAFQSKDIVKVFASSCSC